MKNKLNEKQNKILETIAIVMLIVFALASYFITNLIDDRNKDSRNITIFLNGEKIDININNTFTIGDATGEYNIVEIKDKKIRCIDANCRDKICVNHGYLNSDIDNDMIVCAPHRLIITYQ